MHTEADECYINALQDDRKVTHYSRAFTLEKWGLAQHECGDQTKSQHLLRMAIEEAAKVNTTRKVAFERLIQELVKCNDTMKQSDLHQLVGKHREALTLLREAYKHNSNDPKILCRLIKSLAAEKDYDTAHMYLAILKRTNEGHDKISRDLQVEICFGAAEMNMRMLSVDSKTVLGDLYEELMENQEKQQSILMLHTIDSDEDSTLAEHFQQLAEDIGGVKLSRDSGSQYSVSKDLLLVLFGFTWHCDCKTRSMENKSVLIRERCRKFPTLFNLDVPLGVIQVESAIAKLKREHECPNLAEEFGNELNLLNSLAYFYLRRNKYKDAKPLVEEALAKEPHSLTALANQCEMFLIQYKFPEAEKAVCAMEKESENKEAIVTALAEQGYCYSRMGPIAYMKAIAKFTQAITMGHGHCSADKMASWNFSMASNCSRLLNYDMDRVIDVTDETITMSQCFEVACEWGSLDYWVLERAGKHQRHRRDYIKALELLWKAHSIYPTAFNLHHLGLTYRSLAWNAYKKGEKEKSQDYFRMAIEHAAKDKVPVKVAFQCLMRHMTESQIPKPEQLRSQSELCQLVGRHQEALSLLWEADKQSPGNPDTLSGLIKNLAAKRHYELARMYLAILQHTEGSDEMIDPALQVEICFGAAERNMGPLSLISLRDTYECLLGNPRKTQEKSQDLFIFNANNSQADSQLAVHIQHLAKEGLGQKPPSINGLRATHSRKAIYAGDVRLGSPKVAGSPKSRQRQTNETEAMAKRLGEWRPQEKRKPKQPPVFLIRNSAKANQGLDIHPKGSSVSNTTTNPCLTWA
ncbi:unnamed protein product [Lampetra planeri]